MSKKPTDNAKIYVLYILLQTDYNKITKYLQYKSQKLDKKERAK